jgi:diguanylate cyclase (GGDEF)-like protein
MRPSLGIRSTLYLGLASMGLLVVVVTAAALVVAARVGGSVDEIITERIPQTVETLRVARAADSLVDAGSRLATAVSDRRSVRHAEDAVTRLNDAVERFEALSAGNNHIPDLSARLLDNLARLRQMVEEDKVLVQRRGRLREEMLLNLQVFQTHLTHRVRVLQGDSDVIDRLMSAESPPFERVSGIARGMTSQVATMRFYAEIEALHGRLQAAGQDTSLAALGVSRSVLRAGLASAGRTFDRLPDDLAGRVAAAFAQLRALIGSDEGLPALRAAELRLVNESQVLVDENRRIGASIDTATDRLVSEGMRRIDRDAESASRIRDQYIIAMLAVALIGLIGLAALLYFQIDRRLIARLTWLSGSMQEVASGNLDTPLPPSGADELGRLAAALERFRATEADHRAQETRLREANRKTEMAVADLESANRKLAELSITDGLTGLANRRRLDEVLEQEWARTSHAGRPLAVLLIDVDHFKAFNDRFGHQAGDECLRAVAGAISSRIRRAGDIAARYGGEEFCVVSAYTAMANAEVLALSILEAVRGLAIPHPDSPGGVVTISVGFVSGEHSRYPSADALVHAADQALYAAKRAGRDRAMASVTVPGVIEDPA